MTTTKTQQPPRDGVRAAEVAYWAGIVMAVCGVAILAVAQSIFVGLLGMTTTLAGFILIGAAAIVRAILQTAAPAPTDFAPAVRYLGGRIDALESDNR